MAKRIMTSLSVNLNKLALLRNSRGRNYPDLLHFAERFIELGVQGITIHPRTAAFAAGQFSPPAWAGGLRQKGDPDARAQTELRMLRQGPAAGLRLGLHLLLRVHLL